MIILCHHTMPNQRQCGSPALRGQKYCYYHQPGRRPSRRRARTRYPRLDRQVLRIDNPDVILQTLSGVLQALAADSIGLYQAQTMIYALQLASNLTR